MKSNYRVLRAISAIAFTVGIFLGSATWAIPPHPHDAGKLEFGTAVTNHSHVGGIGVKEVNPGAFLPGKHLVDSAVVETWRTYSTWDNRVYRSGDNNVVQPYAHGYIEPTDATRPRYLFGPNVPGGADLINIKAAIQSIWQQWQTAAKTEGQNTRTTPDGTPLATGLSFRESVAVDMGQKEIDIDFVVGGQFGVWSPPAQTLRFNSTPMVDVRVSNNLGAQNFDWHVSNDGVNFGLTTSVTLPWNFTAAAPTTAGVPNAGNLDYKCVNALGCGGGTVNGQILLGNEGGFGGLGLFVTDSAGGAIIAAADKPVVQADFISVAIHEWGHIVGLDHVSPAGSTMNAASPFTFGVLTRTIDVGSAKGAAVLYSIPVPEPASFLLVLIGVVCFGGCRRRGE